MPEQTLSVEVLAIFISPGHDFRGRHGQGRLAHPVQSLDAVECVAGKGLVGDRYFGFKEDFKGQITFFDASVFAALAERSGKPDLDPSMLRRNVLLQGVDLNSLIGRRFEVQGLVFEGREECKPCYWMDEVAGTGSEAFLKGHGGLRAAIVTGGVLRTGPGTLRVVAS